MEPLEPTPSQVVPSLSALLVCDVAAQDPHTHKTSLLGIFDQIMAADFPVQRQMSVYLRLADAQGFYKMMMRLVEDETDQEIPPRCELQMSIPERNASFEIPLTTPLMEFPRPGRYRFDVSMNGVYLGSAFLQVVLGRP